MEDVKLRIKNIICKTNSACKKLDKIYDLIEKMYLGSVKKICHTPLQHLKSIED